MSNISLVHPSCVIAKKCFGIFDYDLCVLDEKVKKKWNINSNNVIQSKIPIKILSAHTITINSHKVYTIRTGKIDVGVLCCVSTGPFFFGCEKNCVLCRVCCAPIVPRKRKYRASAKPPYYPFVSDNGLKSLCRKLEKKLSLLCYLLVLQVFKTMATDKIKVAVRVRPFNRRGL